MAKYIKPGIKHGHFWVLPLFVFLFTGCPSHIEEMLNSKENIRNYRPVYVTSSISINSADFRKYYAADSNFAFSLPGKDTNAVIPLIFEIRNIEHNNYPDYVELKAYLYDTLGHFITGIAPPHFKGTGTYRDYWKSLTESCSGVSYPIQDYEVTEVRQDAGIPYAMSFVLDHSGSMNGTIEPLKKALKRILRSIKKGDWVSVIDFADTFNIEVPITPDQSAYYNQTKLESEVHGGTHLYDACIASVDELRKAPESHRKIIIIFSDGMDGGSSATLDEIKAIAKSGNIKVYCITYREGLTDFKGLRDLASYTGGKHYHLINENEFPYAFADIYLTLNNYYLIRYKPPVCASIHNVAVNLQLPELNNSNMIANASYDKSIITAFEPVGTVKFLNIEFEFNKAAINPSSMPMIEEVATAMNNNKNITIKVCGHTDDKGDEEYNLKLSRERAIAVKHALESYGVDGDRIKIEGKGEGAPLVPNTNEENRAKNRRTEFIVISNG